MNESLGFLESAGIRWIPFAPLAWALLVGLSISLFRRPLPPRVLVVGSCLSVLAAFGASSAAFARIVGLVGGDVTPEGPLVLVDVLYTWVGVGVGRSAFSADLAFRYDALSAVMCTLITGLGFLVHLYSVGGMRRDARDDGGIQRYFCTLNLFVGAALVLVLADNPLLLVFGWEGTALASYLLIGFWYGDARAARAAQRVFVLDRIAGAALLAGVAFLFWSLARVGAPAVSFRAIEAGFGAVAEEMLVLPAWLGGGEVGVVTAVAGGLLLAAAVRSAQLPFHIGLPRATAAPASSWGLVHLTILALAGIYLAVRLSFLFEAAPGVGMVMAWIGAATALVAAAAATGQDDVGHLLAWVTVSQLGALFVALGCGAYTVAVFHLITHALGMGLVALAVGAVMGATGGERDLQQLGGLRKRLTTTYWLVVVGALALSGFPGLSGFFSRNEILRAVFASDGLPGQALIAAAMVGALLLVTFALFRMLFLGFHGKTRLPRGRRGELDDPEDGMMWPMQVIAVLAVVGGIIGMPQFWGDLMQIEESDSLGVFLAQVVTLRDLPPVEPVELAQLMGLALAASGVGFGAAYVFYVSRPQLRDRVRPWLAWPRRVLARGFWLDDVFDFALVKPVVRISDRLLFRGVDLRLFDRLAEGTGALLRGIAGAGLKHLHSGLAQAYLLFLAAGTVAVLAYLVA